MVLEGGGARILSAHDLTLLQYDALRILSAGRGQRMGELAERLLCDDSTLTRAVSSLVERGWAHRTPDPADRRAALVVLTAPGEARLAAASAAHDAYLRASLEPMAPQAAAAVAELGNRVLASRSAA